MKLFFSLILALAFFPKNVFAAEPDLSFEGLQKKFTNSEKFYPLDELLIKDFEDEAKYKNCSWSSTEKVKPSKYPLVVVNTKFKLQDGTIRKSQFAMLTNHLQNLRLYKVEFQDGELDGTDIDRDVRVPACDDHTWAYQYYFLNNESGINPDGKSSFVRTKCTDTPEADQVNLKRDGDNLVMQAIEAGAVLGYGYCWNE